MDTEIDWRSELDRSFGAGPDGPVEPYLTAGRRAVRRRRVTAVVAAATLAVGGTAAWASSPGSSPRGDAPVASSRPAPEQEQEQVKPTRAERLRSLEELSKAADRVKVDFLGGPAALTVDGLVLSPKSGAVLERVPNPMGYTPEQGSSLAIRVMFEGREHYSLMARFPDDSSSTINNDATGDFEGWLEGVVQSQRTLDDANGVTAPTGTPTADEWLTLGPDGQVEAAVDGVTVLAVRTDLDLGERFAEGTDASGVVRLRVDGRTQVAAFRVFGTQVEAIPAGRWFGSLEAFAVWARDQYASGQGMR